MLLDTLLVWTGPGAGDWPLARRTVLVAAARGLSLTAKELGNLPPTGNHRPCASETRATGSHPAANDSGRLS
jgi:hypothetical protein